MRKNSFSRTLAALAACSITTLGCTEDPTEIVVTVDSLLGVPCAINEVAVELTTAGGETFTQEVGVTDADLPGSITFVSGGNSGQVNVRVEGRLNGTVIVTAEERAITVPSGESLEVGFLLDQTCASSTCAAVRNGPFTDLPAKAPRIPCGQERYTVDTSLVNPRNACDDDADPSYQQVLVSSTETEIDLDASLALPFGFFFYGTPVNQLWVGTNGYLAFSDEAPDAVTGTVSFPRSLEESGGFPTRGILPFWEQLTTNSRGVCAAVSGSAPQRRLWVSWDQVCFNSGAAACGAPEQGNMTFSIGLSEEDGRIFIGFESMLASSPNDGRANGLTAVIGMRGAGAPACSVSACMQGLCDDGSACNYAEFSALAAIAGGLSDTTIAFTPVTTLNSN